MRILRYFTILAISICVLQVPLQGQILKKAKQKLMEKVLGEEEEETQTNTPSPNSGTGSTNDGGRQGKILTPPDVNQHLNEAESYLNAGNYSDARYVIQQAIIGVEMEIGREILKSLPETVNGLAYNPSEDKVYSTGVNFAGMGISRNYGSSNKRLDVGIINNSAMINMYTSMLSSSSYSSSNTDQSQKSVNLQGNRGILKYNQNSDEYELGVPLGQSTVFILTGKRFSSEEEIMEAANQFDIVNIKNMLGEQ